MSYGLNFIRRTLYKLKQRYGELVDLYTATSTVDRGTGLRTDTLTKQSVAQAIPLDASNLIAFFGKQVSGVSLTSRFFVIDAQDATPTLDQYLVYAGKKYEIAEIRDLQFQAGFILVCDATTNEQFVTIFDGSVHHILGLGDSNE